MADLSDISAAQSVKIIGSDATGVESGPITFESHGSGRGLTIGFLDKYLDGFSRLRSSNPFTAFDSTFQLSKQPLLWDESVTGSGTSTHTANKASVELTVTTASADEVIRQTKRYFPYQPGKSQLILMTGNFGTARTNVRKRIGYFDANDGAFFQQDGTINSLVLRTSTSGSPSDSNAVTQSNWNLDKLDGTGTSGFTIDLSKQNIFVIDLQWLGSGRVRFGFDIDGKIIYCHEFRNANTFTVPYMKSGTLPMRVEITNTGASDGSTTLLQTCGTVISEGGFNPQGIIRSVNNGIIAKTISNTRTPLISLRLNSSSLRANIQQLEANIYCSTADEVLFEFIINATLTAASFASAGSGALTEFDTAATAATGGTVIHSGYMSNTGNGVSIVKEALFFQNQNATLGSSLLGVADILTVGCTTFTGTSQINAALTFREVV